MTMMIARMSTLQMTAIASVTPSLAQQYLLSWIGSEVIERR